MAAVDKQWRRCRDISGAFITIFTFSFIGVGCCWALLALFKARQSTARKLKAAAAGEEVFLSGTKIQKDMITKNGTLIVAPVVA